jgi:hypothetical protein
MGLKSPITKVQNFNIFNFFFLFFKASQYEDFFLHPVSLFHPLDFPFYPWKKISVNAYRSFKRLKTHIYTLKKSSVKKIELSGGQIRGKIGFWRVKKRQGGGERNLLTIFFTLGLYNSWVGPDEMSVVTTPNAEYKTRKKVSSTPTFHISPAHFSDHFTLIYRQIPELFSFFTHSHLKVFRFGLGN